MLSGRSSPLPSFTTSQPSSTRTSLTSLTEPFHSLNVSGGAIGEKVALAFSKKEGRLGSYRELPLIKNYLNLFIRLKFNIGGSRTISIPIFKFLYNNPLTTTSLRKDGRLNNLQRQPSVTFISSLPSILGTILILCLSTLLFLALLRPVLPSRRVFSIEANTLILTKEEIERVWRFEMASGRYPSRRRMDIEIGDGGGFYNAGVPKRGMDELKDGMEAKLEERRRLRELSGGRYKLPLPTIRASTSVLPIGLARTYLSPTSKQPMSVFPTRPKLGSAIDLDVVMDHCDFAENKYVRDCLEVLRINAGLDVGLRRGDASGLRATFLPANWIDSSYGPSPKAYPLSLLLEASESISTLMQSSTFSQLLKTRQQLTLAPPKLPPFRPHPSHPTADPACDPANPRLFHVFWAGPFTDKPYLAIQSFLFTQNLALDLPTPPKDLCRAQMWIWINPGPASSLVDKEAESKMFNELEKNPWSSPFLNKRFNEVVKFRLWNTSEQLDGVEEMKGWRDMRLFNSGGTKYGDVNSKTSKSSNFLKDEALPLVADDKILDKSDTEKDLVAIAEADKLGEPEEQVVKLVQVEKLTSDLLSPEGEELNLTKIEAPKPVDELFERVGSASSKGYDRLTVVLSDMARFVLTHRYGGIYLDADNILLRDWEEIWGWKGAFAYRWSRLEKYNTAVLKMQRGSALGNFIFRTAVKNDLDFHPMTISRYTKDAGMEELLLRLPDALFDSAWLNTEYYQRDRPPFPYFKQFEDFFITPKESSSAPIITGFDGFFRGAFSYHFHNGWWIPFDSQRNFPDLGEKFIAGEKLARGRLLKAKLALPKVKSNKITRSFFRSKPKDDSISSTEQATYFVGPNGEKLSLNWGEDERDFQELDWSKEKIEFDIGGQIGKDGSSESERNDLSWSQVLKRTFESYVRGERGNMYGEILNWNE